VLAVAGLPPALPGLVRACMAKSPDDRPKSAAVALALWGLPGPARPAMPFRSRPATDPGRYTGAELTRMASRFSRTPDASPGARIGVTTA